MTLREYDLVSGLIRLYLSLELTEHAALPVSGWGKGDNRGVGGNRLPFTNTEACKCMHIPTYSTFYITYAKWRRSFDSSNSFEFSELSLLSPLSMGF